MPTSNAHSTPSVRSHMAGAATWQHPRKRGTVLTLSQRTLTDHVLPQCPATALLTGTEEARRIGQQLNVTRTQQGYQRPLIALIHEALRRAAPAKNWTARHRRHGHDDLAVLAAHTKHESQMSPGTHRVNPSSSSWLKTVVDAAQRMRVRRVVACAAEGAAQVRSA